MLKLYTIIKDDCIMKIIVALHKDYVDVSILIERKGIILPVFNYKALENPDSFSVISFLRRLGSAILNNGVEFPPAQGNKNDINYYVNIFHNIRLNSNNYVNLDESKQLSNIDDSIELYNFLKSI